MPTEVRPTADRRPPLASRAYTRPPLWVLAPLPLEHPARAPVRPRRVRQGSSAAAAAAAPLLGRRPLSPSWTTETSVRAAAPLLGMTAATAAAGEPAPAAAADRRPAAVVIGAGPAGALAALHLARGGYSPVTVIEARAPPPSPIDKGGVAATAAAAAVGAPTDGTPPSPSPTRRSYSIVLNERGLAALADFPGLPAAVAAVGVVITGSCQYGKKGPRVASTSERMANNVSVDRGALVGALYRYATEVAPPGVTGGIDWVWGRRVVGVDWAARVVTSEAATPPAGEQADDAPSLGRIDYPYDLLVVAQGVYSSVRDAAVSAGLLTYTATPDKMEYKIANLGNSTRWHAAPHPPPRSGMWHIFHAHRSTPLMLAPPWVDSAGEPCVRAVVIMSPGGWSRELVTPAAVEALFMDRFPEIWGPGVPPPPAVVSDLLAQPVSVGGVTGVCSRYDLAGGSAVLVGDCAASVWPSLGQGCNLALAGVAALGATLFPPPAALAGTAAPSVDGAATPPSADPPLPPPPEVVADRLAAHTLAWKPNADAAGQVSERGFGGNSRAMTRATTARLAVVAVASRVLSTPGPALMELGNPAVPYATVLRRWLAEEAAVNRVVGGIGVAAVVAAVAWVVPIVLMGGGV
ncbi:hypothetical protein MMPV_001003 [Pyropia vietnamensis]